MITVPKTLRGHPVILRWEGINLAAVIVDLGPTSADRYVIAQWWPALKHAWSNGDYTSDPTEAARSFIALAARLKRLDPPFEQPYVEENGPLLPFRAEPE